MELDDEMASLSINEKKRRLSSSSDHRETVTGSGYKRREVKVRRSTRKKVCRQYTEKRRVETKPRKYDVNNYRNIESYYLDKSIKQFRSSLETIHEEPKSDSDNSALMSSRKYKRSINMTTVDKLKVKKRRMKAKKLSGTKKLTVSKVAMEELMKQLKTLEDTD